MNLNRFLAANAGLVVIPVARIGPKLCSLVLAMCTMSCGHETTVSMWEKEILYTSIVNFYIYIY